MEWETHMRQEFWKRMIKNPNKSSALEWRAMSSHPFLARKMLENNPHRPWQWRHLSRQEFDKIRVMLLRMPYKDWDWHHLSSTCPMDFIIAHPQLAWIHGIVYDRYRPSSDVLCNNNNNNDWIDRSKSTPLSVILSSTFLPWRWKIVTRRPDMSFDPIFRHPHLQWDIRHAMVHLPFASHHLLTPSTITIDYSALSTNPHLDRPMLYRHLHKSWDWNALARHPAFPPHIIYQDPLLQPLWRWDRCLLHPRLSLNFYHIIRHQFTIPCHFSLLVRNHFHTSETIHPYFHAVLRRFLLRIFFRRTLLKKLRFFLHLRLHLSLGMLLIIIEFI
jgi:hypothetical protein